MQVADSEGWSIQDSAALYGLERWGEPYFTINGRGHISVQPQGERGGSLDLVELVSELRGRNLGLPLLIRFDDILEDRLERLHAAFERAIAQYSYTGRYQGVFPVKCNQQRHVVEELVTCGKRWNFGLEAGSKAELLIALSLLDDPEALLICNGYKDRLYIETAILARRLGRQWRLLEMESALRARAHTPLLGMPIGCTNDRRGELQGRRVFPPHHPIGGSAAAPAPERRRPALSPRPGPARAGRRGRNRCSVRRLPGAACERSSRRRGTAPRSGRTPRGAPDSAFGSSGETRRGSGA